VRNALATLVSIGMLVAVPALGKGGLNLTCTTRGLPPGARVWIEVEARYQGVAAEPSAGGAFRDSGAAQYANGKHVWQFQVPPIGEVAPASYEFQFPDSVDQKRSDHQGSIYLQTRFRIDSPTGRQRAGYGEVQEMTFGLPVPPGATQLARCLRLREDGNRLRVETAKDCRDSSFAQPDQNGIRVHMSPSSH
jgi:hypothetical protein